MGQGGAEVQLVMFVLKCDGRNAREAIGRNLIQICCTDGVDVQRLDMG